MRLAFVVAVLSSGCVLLTACTTPTTKAAQTAAPTSRPRQTAANADNPLICGSVEVTGSRISRQRECHTAAEWAKMKAEGLAEFTLDAQRSLPSKGGN